jgi:superoxide dismutase
MNPILGIDLWEHAYYLKYKNLRKDYLENIFNCIDWEIINKRLENIK